MKFVFYKEVYDVIKKEVDDYRIVYFLNETRNRKFFAYLPIKKNKFKWLCNVEVQERRLLVFNRLFNPKFPDEKYYARPIESWIIENIL